MALDEGQVHLVGTGRDFLMGEGTQYDLQDDFNPFIRQTRADQGGPRPYAHGSWLGAEFTAEVVVPLRVIANGTAGDVPTTRRAIQDMIAAFRAVGATGEIAELRFRLDEDPDEFVMFGRPRGPEPDMKTIGHGYVYASAAFVAADPRIYSGELTTVTTGMAVQRGGLILPARPATARLRLPDVSGAYSSTPHHASLAIIGDLDLRIGVDLASWTDGFQQLITRYTTGNISFALNLDGSGIPRIQWTTDGSTILTAPASTGFGADAGLVILRGTLDVDNGAGGRTATFYTGPTLAGPWTQFGSTVTQAGVTSVFAGTSPLEIGSRSGGTTQTIRGTVYGAQVRSGINGTIVANPDFTQALPGATSLVDSTGKTWTVHGDARLVGNTYRGGVTLPTTIPGRLVGGSITITNTGDAAAPLLLRIDGPAVEPWIRVQRPDGVVQTVRFDLTLTDGQWLTVDSVSRQALLNDQPNANQRGNASWDMDEYPILPGVTVIRFGAAEYDPDAELSASARSAWN
jgi:hypothetical protein